MHGVTFKNEVAGTGSQPQENFIQRFVGHEHVGASAQQAPRNFPRAQTRHYKLQSIQAAYQDQIGQSTHTERGVVAHRLIGQEFSAPVGHLLYELGIGEDHDCFPKSVPWRIHTTVPSAKKRPSHSLKGSPL